MNYRETDWYLAIKDMPVGTRLRMPHAGCSVGDALMVSKTDKGVNAWCFLCKQPGMFVPAPPESLAHKLARINSQSAVDATLQKTKALPLPKVENPSEWPLEARLWLYKAGINNADIMASGIYYHSGSSRVVIPVYHGSTLVYWQARGFEKDMPKYLNPPSGERGSIVAQWPGDKRCLVLTEDWLSGYRVHRATGLEVNALLGTYLNDTIAGKIINGGYETVAVWLDGDKPGQDSARVILKKLRAFNIPAINIVTQKDPKLYSNREIKEILNESGLGISPQYPVS